MSRRTNVVALLGTAFLTFGAGSQPAAAAESHDNDFVFIGELISQDNPKGILADNKQPSRLTFHVERIRDGDVKEQQSVAMTPLVRECLPDLHLGDLAVVAATNEGLVRLERDELELSSCDGITVLSTTEAQALPDETWFAPEDGSRSGQGSPPLRLARIPLVALVVTLPAVPFVVALVLIESRRTKDSL